MNKLIVALGLMAVGLPAFAQLPAGVVPITSEPHHGTRFQNGQVRIIDARVPKGGVTLFHEHRHDGFFVFLSAEGFVNEPFDGKATTPLLSTGAVQFIPAAKPYIHRVGAAGSRDVYVSAVELLSPAGARSKQAEERFPPFEIAMQNARGRVYRLKLGPGDATDAFTRPAGTAIFAITAGQIAETSNGKPIRTWDLTPGAFRWADSPEELTIRNVGPTTVELVEIEVL